LSSGVGKLAARHEDACAGNGFGGIAVGQFLAGGDHAVTLLARLHHAQQRGQGHCGPAPGGQRCFWRQHEPALGREQRLRVGGEGFDLDAALDAPGAQHAAHFDASSGRAGASGAGTRPTA
jgi:hypothetical protein